VVLHHASGGSASVGGGQPFRLRARATHGKKCFLGTKTPGDKKHPDFPICNKGTCKVNTKGLYAAYIRARQWGKPKSSYKGRSRPRFSQKYYKNIANKAKRMLRERGHHVGN
jgi:hypothetical protein